MVAMLDSTVAQVVEGVAQVEPLLVTRLVELAQAVKDLTEVLVATKTKATSEVAEVVEPVVMVQATVAIQVTVVPDFLLL
jgi:hypothetical protein